MQSAGIVQQYAIFGAMAQSRYTEPAATLDVDVLVAVPGPERLDSLSGIYEFCAARGYRAEGEAIRIGNWPVQFVPAFDSLTREALGRAEATTFAGLPCRVVGADFLAAIVR